MGSSTVGRLSVVDVAEALGVTKQTVYNWLKSEGLPSLDTPRGKVITIRDLVDWHISKVPRESVKPFKSESDETFDEAVLRKTVAEADIKELTLAEMRRQVASIEDVEKVLTAANLATKTQIEALPSRLSVQLIAISDQAIIHGIVERETSQLLTNLATIKDVTDKIGVTEAEEE